MGVLGGQASQAQRMLGIINHPVAVEQCLERQAAAAAPVPWRRTSEMPASLRGLPTSMLSAIPISTVNTCAKWRRGMHAATVLSSAAGTWKSRSVRKERCRLELCCCQGRPRSNAPQPTYHREHFAMRTGMAGCMQVATVTPDISMPRMYSSCGVMAEGRQATVG